MNTMIVEERDSFEIMDSRDLVEDLELDQEDKSMENASAELSALTLEELPHTDPRPKRFGEPMEEEIYATKRFKIAEGELMPEQCHFTPQKGIADTPEASLELEHDDGDDDEDFDVVSDDDTTQKGDDISEWLVNFLNAVLDDDEDEEDTFLNFKEKRRQFRKRVNKCLDEALGSDDVVSNHQEDSDEDEDIILSDEDDDILSVEDGEEVSDKVDEEISDDNDDHFSDDDDVNLLDEDEIIFTDQDHEEIPDEDDDIFDEEDDEKFADEDVEEVSDEDEDYFAEEDDDNNNNDY